MIDKSGDTNVLRRDPASYRDPAGHVFFRGNRVFRVVMPAGLRDFRAFQASPGFRALQERRWLPATRILGTDERHELGFTEGGIELLEHAAVPLISYPYEWPFEALRAAAVLQLQLHQELLAQGFTLKDASAFNIQFDGTSPVFIDLLSVRPYREGEYWVGHDQFIRHFLAPLLLEAYTGIPAQPWLRASLEGIDPAYVAQLLPNRSRLDFRLWIHLFLPVRFEGRRPAAGDRPAIPSRPLPLSAMMAMLRQLEGVVSGLRPPRRRETAWSGYANATSYAAEAEEAKANAVRAFVERTSPARLADVGCNDGRYSRIALEAGARRVFGLDADVIALDRAFVESRRLALPYTSIVQDLANPSPAQGWMNEERRPIFDRLQADAVIALAVVHHLAIGRNVPLAQIARMLLAIAPQVLVEFVPKEDPMVKLMLSQREDVFADYAIGPFMDAVRSAGGDVVWSQQLPGSKRQMLHLRKRSN